MAHSRATCALGGWTARDIAAPRRAANITTRQRQARKPLHGARRIGSMALARSARRKIAQRNISADQARRLDSDVIINISLAYGAR